MTEDRYYSIPIDKHLEIFIYVQNSIGIGNYACYLLIWSSEKGGYEQLFSMELSADSADLAASSFINFLEHKSFWPDSLDWSDVFRQFSLKIINERLNKLGVCGPI